MYSPTLLSNSFYEQSCVCPIILCNSISSLMLELEDKLAPKSYFGLYAHTHECSSALQHIHVIAYNHQRTSMSSLLV